MTESMIGSIELILRCVSMVTLTFTCLTIVTAIGKIFELIFKPLNK